MERKAHKGYFTVDVHHFQLRHNLLADLWNLTHGLAGDYSKQHNLIAGFDCFILKIKVWVREMPVKSKQMLNGKAFEYSLLLEFDEKLTNQTKVEIVRNTSLNIAKECFYSLNKVEQKRYRLSSSFTVNFLCDIEPRLKYGISDNDILQLEIASDDKGKIGDVRDLLMIRVLQKWEIGISAKNNNYAVKHSRLSKTIDFGEKWFSNGVSAEYFDEINPIFDYLHELKISSDGKAKWVDIKNLHELIYVPVLTAFKNEMLRFMELKGGKIPQKMIKYLVGNQDFYKVIQSKNKIEIHAFNINGTLNLPFKNIKPKFNTPVLKLPTKIDDVFFKENSLTTLIIKFNNNWTLSFRIHNASSRVESSLKFDIKLIDSPKSLFINKLEIK